MMENFCMRERDVEVGSRWHVDQCVMLMLVRDRKVVSISGNWTKVTTLQRSVWG